MAIGAYEGQVGGLDFLLVAEFSEGSVVVALDETVAQSTIELGEVEITRFAGQLARLLVDFPFFLLGEGGATFSEPVEPP